MNYNVSPEKAPARSSGSTKATPTKSNDGVGGYGNGAPCMAPKVKGWSPQSQGR